MKMLPLAVSPLSMMQSEPSKTALATSEASARVGRGLETMLSSIWVAHITGLPCRLHFAISIFWATNTWPTMEIQSKRVLSTHNTSLTAVSYRMITP